MFLTDAEINEMCAPLVARAAQGRYLRKLGLTVNEKPNGRPLVVRSHAEALLSGLNQTDPQAAPSRPSPQPNRAALEAIYGQRMRDKAKKNTPPNG